MPKFNPNAPITPVKFDPSAEITPVGDDQAAPVAPPPPGPLGLDGQPLPLSHINKAGIPVYQGTPASAGRYTSNAPSAPPTDWRTPLTKIHPHGEGDGSSWLDSGSGDIRDLMTDPLASTRELVKSFANIGGSGLSMALHPVYTAKSIVRQLADSPQAITEMANQAVTNPLETAEGAIGQAGITEGLGEAIPRVLKAARAAPESIMRIATNTGASPVKDLVKQTQAKNVEIDKANAQDVRDHISDTRDALHEQQGRELGYRQDVANKAREINQSDQSEAADLLASRRAEEQRINAANDAVRAKHQTVAQKVQAANQAAENMLELRRQHEQAYQQATDTHYAKEAAADTKAKSEENQAWSAWRQKTAGKTLDGGQISNPLQKLRLDSPEVDRTLNQLEPRGDEVPQESPYAQIREQTSQQHFGKDYQSLSPVKQDEIDDLLHTNGYSPEPIAFDPQAGQPIAIDRVQRASSILQRYIRSGRFEGPLLGEMKQVARVLRDAVTRASADAGAAADLDSARNATITYQGAFGREIKTPTTARTIREQQVNPEAFQTREDEARLARARRYDPTLVDSYRQVKAAREALDKLPPEDQLRKSLRQVPPPPSVDDARPGFRLKASPKPTPARLTSGSAYERAAQAVNQPDRPPFPDRPVPTPNQTISAGDIQSARKIAAEASAGKWWNRGRWAAAAPVIWAMRGFFGGRIPSILNVGAETGGLLVSTRMATSLLRYPPMIEFLSKARPEDVALIPSELRGDLPGLVSQAQRAGVRVSPILAAYAATVQRNRGQGQPVQQQQPVTQGKNQ